MALFMLENDGLLLKINENYLRLQRRKHKLWFGPVFEGRKVDVSCCICHTSSSSHQQFLNLKMCILEGPLDPLLSATMFQLLIISILELVR
jgi:hypothetical protein